jgi:hypothetical protein
MTWTEEDHRKLKAWGVAARQDREREFEEFLSKRGVTGAGD